MSRIRTVTQIVSACIAASLLVGCNVGMAPSGGSSEEVKAAFDKMPLEEQVKLINGSSMPAEQKKQRIEDAYKKAGKTPPGDAGASSNAPSGPPPGMGMPSQGGR